jgi:hypothetical protein
MLFLGPGEDSCGRRFKEAIEKEFMFVEQFP